MAIFVPSAAPRQGRVSPPEAPGLSSLLTLAVGVVVVAALHLGQDVFIPIVLAVLLSFVLAPLVNLLRRLRLGRVPAVVVAVLLALGVLSALGAVIGGQVAQIATELPQYQYTITRKVEQLRAATIGRASSVLQDVGEQVKKAAEGPPPSENPAAAAAPVEKTVPVEVRQPDLSPFELTKRVLAPVVAPVATTGIVLIVAIFILMQREDLRNRMIRLFGSTDLHRTTVAMDDAARRLSRYFLTQLGLNAVFGVFIGAGLWLIGVPGPILWGIVACLMRFVPYIGSFVAAAAPVALAAAVDPGWSMVLWTVALFAISEPLMGHVVEPTVYGHSTGLSPFAVIVAAIFWTWLWGPIGLLLSTPFTVCLVVLGRHVDRLEFLDVLLGDRPALTPVQSFYQRMLSGDPDEAQEHAEQLLKDRSLSSYYDEVALQGLQLAAKDARRGVLTDVQLETIRHAVQELVDNLSTHEDVDPASNGSDDDAITPPASERELPKKPALTATASPQDGTAGTAQALQKVLCVAGRGPLDDGAAAMLAQLLEKHGFEASVLPHEAVSRHNLGALDLTDVAMICISYLEIKGNPAHLRNLLRRLRARARDVPIVVGLWPAEEAILTDEELRARVGADEYVVSLREALKACLERAHRDPAPGMRIAS